ncbi:amidohydrolase family protein [Sphingomonas sp. 2R-10]|uniref:amidohydrolase family protein n=1 Tax=Sphingomonas sp. 2R-10 TaxID=3045148 RepID=UPI000F796A13|nr:amidohydrolase family protein [Sphingomonas sp. 2R-10]MDJ0275921.1 amidohydrolase family protein [Sphingomonas sp. 2R-10]
MNKLPFVDAHVHLWDLDHLRYPWLTPPFDDDGPNGSVESIAKTYRLADYRADAGDWDVRGIVHVDAGATPDAALDETRWLQAMADREGLPNAIVAFADLYDPDVDTLLAAHAAHRNVRGIRHIVNWHADPRRTYTPRDVTRDGAWSRGYARLAAQGLSFDLQAYPGQFAGLAELIERHPETPVMVNHMGMCVPGEEAEWRDGLTALARLPHVAIKLSGVGFTHRRWTLEQARGLVLTAIDRFGTDRAMVASDFPTDKLFGSFAATLGAYAAITADFTDAERRALFAGNANRLYRMGLKL